MRARSPYLIECRKIAISLTLPSRNGAVSLPNSRQRSQMRILHEDRISARRTISRNLFSGREREPSGIRSLRRLGSMRDPRTVGVADVWIIQEADPGGRIRSTAGLATASGNPLGPDEVRPPEGVVLVRMDHRPREVRRADEELGVAVRSERDQGASASISPDHLSVHMHRECGHPGRERDDQIMVARLTPVFVIGPRPVPQPRPAAKRLGVDAPPRRLGLEPRRFGQPLPLNSGAAEVALQFLINRLGEGISSTRWLTTSLATRPVATKP